VETTKPEVTEVVVLIKPTKDGKDVFATKLRNQAIKTSVYLI